MVMSIGIPRLAVAASAVLLISATAPSSSRTSRFAQGVIQVARLQRAHDPRALTRLLEIPLRDPGKWLGQPDGTYREARWRNPVSNLGVTLVSMIDVPVSDGREVSSSTDIDLTGQPCISVRAIERAAGKRAEYGGVAIPMMILDAPELTPPPHQLGDEHSSLGITGRYGGSTMIVMHAQSPGPDGCLDSISLQSTRPALDQSASSGR
jgi:hypothetical protein